MSIIGITSNENKLILSIHTCESHHHEHHVNAFILLRKFHGSSPMTFRLHCIFIKLGNEAGNVEVEIAAEETSTDLDSLACANNAENQDKP